MKPNSNGIFSNNYNMQIYADLRSRDIFVYQYGIIDNRGKEEEEEEEEEEEDNRGKDQWQERKKIKLGYEDRRCPLELTIDLFFHE